jgi:hypothetical protein
VYGVGAKGLLCIAVLTGVPRTYGALSVVVDGGGGDIEATARSRCQIRAGVGARMVWVLAYFKPQASFAGVVDDAGLRLARHDHTSMSTKNAPEFTHSSTTTPSCHDVFSVVSDLVGRVELSRRCSDFQVATFTLHFLQPVCRRAMVPDTYCTRVDGDGPQDHAFDHNW